MKRNLKFTTLVLILAAVLGALAFVLSTFVNKSLVFNMLASAIAVAALTTIFAYVIVSGGLSLTGGKFVTRLLGAMMLKMLVGLLLVGVMALIDIRHIDQYVIAYFVAYLIFTAFEVNTLLRNLRAEKKETPPAA